MEPGGENTQNVLSLSFIAEWSSEFVNTSRGFHCFESELKQIKQMPVSRNLHVLIFLNTHGDSVLEI